MKHLKPLAKNEFVPSMITPIHPAPLRRADIWGWLGHTQGRDTHNEARQRLHPGRREQEGRGPVPLNSHLHPPFAAL